MSTLTSEKRQLNVRVDRRAAELLEARVAQAKRAGRRVTKEKLVSDAIVAAYDQEHDDLIWLPVCHGTWNAPPEAATSNAALWDWIEQVEAEQAEAERAEREQA